MVIVLQIFFTGTEIGLQTQGLISLSDSGRRRNRHLSQLLQKLLRLHRKTESCGQKRLIHVSIPALQMSLSRSAFSTLLCPSSFKQDDVRYPPPYVIVFNVIFMKVWNPLPFSFAHLVEGVRFRFQDSFNDEACSYNEVEVVLDCSMVTNESSYFSLNFPCPYTLSSVKIVCYAPVSSISVSDSPSSVGYWMNDTEDKQSVSSQYSEDFFECLPQALYVSDCAGGENNVEAFILKHAHILHVANVKRDFRSFLLCKLSGVFCLFLRDVQACGSGTLLTEHYGVLTSTATHLQNIFALNVFK